MEKKKRGLKLVLLFFAIAFILALAGTFLFTKARTQNTPLIEKSIPPFKVDQILIKVLIKEDESMARPINIMNTYTEDLDIEIRHQYLLDMVSVSDSNFVVRPGQTKTVQINFRAIADEKSIKQKPGAYVGNLLFTNNLNIVRTPTIIEIETKDVLFDANIEVPIGQKQIKQDGYLDVKITLFNLKRIGLTNLDVEYFVKDIVGNTIITETESVTVETQASFVKTIHLPKNLNPGEYVFGAIVRYGSSVGTSTLLFEVIEPEIMEISLIGFYRNNQALSLIIVISLAILISFIGSHISLMAGAFIHGKVFHPLKEKPQKSKKIEERKIARKEVKPKRVIKKREFKHKKLIWMLLCLAVILSIVAYILYSRGITLERLTYLWSLIANWLKRALGEILPYIRDLWGNILYYASPQRRYFYYALWLAISLTAIICFVAIAKKTHFFGRLKARLKQRKEEKAKRREQLKKEEKRIAKKDGKKEIKKKFKIFEKFKRLPKNEKVVLLIILAILFLIVLVSFLIEFGVLSAEQLGRGNIAFLK